jgi:hypothetical protein
VTSSVSAMQKLEGLTSRCTHPASCRACRYMGVGGHSVIAAGAT